MFNSYNLIHYRIGFLTSDTFFPYQSKLSKKEKKIMRVQTSDTSTPLWRKISEDDASLSVFLGLKFLYQLVHAIFRSDIFLDSFSLNLFSPFEVHFRSPPSPLFFLSSAKKAVDNKLKYRTKGLNGGSKKLEMGLYREELKSELGASGSPSSSLYLPPPPKVRSTPFKFLWYISLLR